MKRIVAIIFGLALILMGMPLTTFASGTNWTSTENVNLSKTQNQFNVEISVNNLSPYAGAEFGIQCAEGITVKSVTYSSGASKAGPTAARGLTWFSFFSGSNDFTGKVTAIATVEYSGTQNTSIVIDSISVYTKNGAVVDTEKLTPRKLIKVNREGADNPITPQPTPTSSNSPLTPTNRPTNNDPTSNGNNNTDTNQNQQDNSTNNQSSSNQQSNDNIQNDNASTVNSTVDSNNNSSSDNGQNNNSTNGIGVNSPEDSNNIQNKSYAPINIGIIIALIISFGVNVVLGYFIIKIKNKKENG